MITFIFLLWIFFCQTSKKKIHLKPIRFLVNMILCAMMMNSRFETHDIYYVYINISGKTSYNKLYNIYYIGTLDIIKIGS